MIHARLRADGSLSDIWEREPIDSEDVPLDAKPEGYGPFAYDLVTKLAIPHVTLITARETEKCRREAEAIAGRKYALLTLRAVLLRASKSTVWVDELIAKVDADLIGRLI